MKLLLLQAVCAQHAVTPVRSYLKAPLTSMHRKLGNSYLETNLVNYDNMVYTGPLYFGTPWQGSANSTFIYDSGS
jgi:hypothetical protein